MLKSLSRLSSALKGSTPKDPTPRASPLPIILPQSAVDAYPADPHPIVGSLIDYVNTLTGQGRYNRLEVPARAMQAFHMDYYLAQVNNGGHAQFVHNCAGNLPFTIDDILRGLNTEAGEEYLMIAHNLQTWLGDNPEEAKRQTGFEGGIAEEMSALDDMFYALEADGSLRDLIAERIATAPELVVVADADLTAARARVCAANPNRALRDRILTIATLNRQMTDPFQVAVSCALGQMQPVNALIQLGNGSHHDVDGSSRMSFPIATTGGKVWAVLADDTVEIRAYIEHDNPDMPQDPFDASMDQISKWKAPEVGALLSAISPPQAQMATQTAEALKAAAAVELLLSKLTTPAKVDRITIRSAGKDTKGIMGMTLLLILNNATLAMAVTVTSDAATLLAEPSHDRLAQVTRAEIDVHATRFGLEKLLG